jgi:hypothetical protein
MKMSEDISQRVIHERTVQEILAEMRAQIHQKHLKFNDLSRIVRYATLKQAQQKFSFDKQAEWEFKDVLDTHASNPIISPSIAKHILNEQLGLNLTENENNSLVQYYNEGGGIRIKDLLKDISDETHKVGRKGREPTLYLKSRIKQRYRSSEGISCRKSSVGGRNASSFQLTYYDPHAQQSRSTTTEPVNHPEKIEEVVEKQPEVSNSQESLKVDQKRTEQAARKPDLSPMPKNVSKAALKEMKDSLNNLKGVLLRVMPKDFTMDDLFNFVDCKQNGIINKAALFRLFYKTHVKVKRRVLDTMMEVYDRDRDGKLNFSEFSVAFTMSGVTQTTRSASRNQKRKAHGKIAHLYSEFKEQSKAKSKNKGGAGLSLAGNKMKLV